MLELVVSDVSNSDELVVKLSPAVDVFAVGSAVASSVLWSALVVVVSADEGVVRTWPSVVSAGVLVWTVVGEVSERVLETMEVDSWSR